MRALHLIRRDRLVSRIRKAGIELRVHEGQLRFRGKPTDQQRRWIAEHRDEILADWWNLCPWCRHRGCAACDNPTRQEGGWTIVTCPLCSGEGCRFCMKTGEQRMC